MSNRLREHARELRKNQTDAEQVLWSRLRRKRIEGARFRRQQPIGPYIVDFVSFDRRLVIEVDGSQHDADGLRDSERDNFLGDRGYRVLRFWNNEVLNELGAVLEVIRGACLSHFPGTGSSGEE